MAKHTFYVNDNTPTSTGKVLPGIVKVGTLPKKSANLPASMVAEVTISFMSERRDITEEKMSENISFWNVSRDINGENFER